MHSFISVLSFIAPLVAAQIGGAPCEPILSLPNPIANKFRTQNTGTINSTLAILPINYTLARSIIPSEYPILQAQYQQWIPSLSTDMYPALLQMELHHDVYNKGKSAGAGGDYLRASVSLPFVDRLNDGYTAMTYSQQVLISSANTDAQSALQAYGYTVAPAYFAVCNAYEYENGTANMAKPPAKRGIDQAGWANTNTDLSNPDIAYRFVPVKTSPYSTKLFQNITNQPLFSDGTTCDKVVRIFNSDVTQPPHPLVRVQGDAAVLKPFFTPKAKTVWQDVYGLKLDVAYHETPNVDCSKLKGTHVVNAPA